MICSDAKVMESVYGYFVGKTIKSDDKRTYVAAITGYFKTKKEAETHLIKRHAQ